MKRKASMKRIMAFLLSAVMLFSLCTTAFAEETAGSKDTSAVAAVELTENDAPEAEPENDVTEPAAEEAPTAGETPATGEVPVVGEVPASDETPVPGEAPSADETPAVGETSVTGEDLSVDGTPTVDATLAPVAPLKVNKAPAPVKAPAVEESSTGEEVPEAVQAFLAAVEAIEIPEVINEETGPVLNEQIGAASDAYDALSEEELEREDVQEAVIAMQTAMDVLTGGVDPLALLTGEQFSIVVNVGYMDGNTFVRTGSKTVVSTCRYGCGHSGYNHTMSAAEIVAQAGYSGSSWRVTRYGYWDNPASTTTVNYNITGSAPYKADQAIWVIGEKPSQGGSTDPTPPGPGGDTGETSGIEVTVKPVYIDAEGNYTVQNTPKTIKLQCTSTSTYHTHGRNCTLNCSGLNHDFFNVPSGYTRVGWSNTTNRYFSDYNLTVNWNSGQILYIVYKIPAPTLNTFSMTYDAQGGKVEGKDTHTLTIRTTDTSYSFLSIEPTRDGYKFLGWYDGTSSSASKITWPYVLSLVGNATSASKTVYAKWEKLSDTHVDATIIYQNGGGTGGPITETVPGSAEYKIKAPAAVDITGLEGKVFSHWAKGQDMYFPGDTFIPEDGSTNTFVAVWKDDDSQTGNATYTVTWYDNDGKIIKAAETRRGTLNQPISVKDADKVLSGYTFNEDDTRNVLQAVLEKENGTELKLYFTATPDASDWTQLTIEKTADRETAKPGDEITYTIKVTNNTGKDLTDILVSEKLNTNLSFVKASGDGQYNANTGVWTISTLASDAKAVLTITATVNDDVADKTVIPNAATITSAATEDDKSLPADSNPSDSADITVDKPETPPAPVVTDWDKLTIKKQADKTTVKPGDTVTYTITVSNKTGKDLKDITVSEKLDANLTFVNADKAGEYDAAAGVWSIPSLANGADAILTIKATVNSNVADKTIIKNIATITGAETTDADKDKLPDDKHPDSNADVIVDNPVTPPAPEKPDWNKLTLSKTADASSVKPGKNVTYTIKVSNNTGKDLTDITVSEKLDANLTFVSSNGAGKYDAATGVWTIPSLADHSDAVLTITATVSKKAGKNTVIKNTAVITDANAGNDEKLPVDHKPTGSADITIDSSSSGKKPHKSHSSGGSDDSAGAGAAGAAQAAAQVQGIGSPQTGDSNSPMLWVTLILLSAALIFGITVMSRKKKSAR